ncbi:hypothetical protein ES703_110073 [subsurface metagenome]
MSRLRLKFLAAESQFKELIEFPNFISPAKYPLIMGFIFRYISSKNKSINKLKEGKYHFKISLIWSVILQFKICPSSCGVKAVSIVNIPPRISTENS